MKWIPEDNEFSPHEDGQILHKSFQLGKPPTYVLIVSGHIFPIKSSVALYL